MPATFPLSKSIYLAGLALLFVVLGLGYSVLTPVFENSDETLHYPYVKHLADGRGLPLAVPNQLWNQEGTQPPLYYAIVAASTFWLDTDNMLDLLQRNPHWLFSDVRLLINDNQNLVLHGPPDAFPYRRAALAVHIGRWWSLLFGLLTVVGTFLLARRLFPHHLPLAVTAATLTALNPQFLRVSATVSNDSLSAALTTWAVLAAFKFTEPPVTKAGEQGGRGAGDVSQSPLVPRSPAPLLLGLLTGLAILTKLSSLSTLFLVGFIIFWRLFFLSEAHEAPLQTMLRWWLIIGVVVVALTGWWFWRNYSLYGEWFVTETHLNLAGRSHLSLAEIWSLRAEAERAFWATFGWGQIRPPEWVYSLLFLFSRIGLVGMGLALLGKLVQGDKSKPLPLNLSAVNFEVIIPLLLWAALNLALYLRWLMEVGSVSHTRLVFPAIAAISLLLALGWHALLPHRLAGWFSGAVILAFLWLNLYSLGWLIYPAFRPNEQVSQPVNKLDVTFLDSLKLVSGQVHSAPTGLNPPATATQGDVILIDALWQTAATPDKNYSVAAVLLAPDGRVLARRETYPGLGLRPTRYLQPGDSFLDTYPLKLEADVSEPLVARAAVNLFDFESDSRAGFPALDAGGSEVTPIVGEIKIVPKTWPKYEPTHTVQVNFAAAIALIGYDFAPPAEGTGQGTITLYWQSLAPVSEDYVVFVHLLDERGEIIGQADGPPTHNTYPTRWWSPGETIADTRTLPSALGLVALRLGLYDLASGQRLPITESNLPQQDNSVEIALP
ncbi:MAG: glycosyltransferase family 39 protein [Anaerolineae bacterium]|nr:glycosyltransferase family 39 protein [Anaerolineae bacterium]